MLFALVAHDRPNRVALRMELRPNHLKFLEGLGDQLKLAGPFLDEDGNMVGSIVVIEAETLEAARIMFARDPFASLDAVIELGCERLLTSGQAVDALAGAALIRTLIEHARGRITGFVLQSGRVRELRFTRAR